MVVKLNLFAFVEGNSEYEERFLKCVQYQGINHLTQRNKRTLHSTCEKLKRNKNKIYLKSKIR